MSGDMSIHPASVQATAALIRKNQAMTQKLEELKTRKETVHPLEEVVNTIAGTRLLQAQFILLAVDDFAPFFYEKAVKIFENEHLHLAHLYSLAFFAQLSILHNHTPPVDFINEKATSVQLLCDQYLSLRKMLAEKVLELETNFPSFATFMNDYRNDATGELWLNADDLAFWEEGPEQFSEAANQYLIQRRLDFAIWTENNSEATEKINEIRGIFSEIGRLKVGYMSIHEFLVDNQLRINGKLPALEDSEDTINRFRSYSGSTTSSEGSSES